MSDWMKSGVRVRLKSNPARTGVLSGKTAGTAASPRWEVIFEGRTDFVPQLALEPVSMDGGNPWEDMAQLRFGHPRALRVALTHARLGGRLTDLIYSLYTTNTDFYAYQFKPVLAFLDSPSRGILIADEVGLGKTIEAGLIWTELRSREDAKRLLVVCPAMLCEKWQLELSERFGVEARICNAEDTVKVLEQAARNPRASFAIVASMQGLRALAAEPEEDDSSSSARRLQTIGDDAGDVWPLDMVIVDEAHYMRNPETLTAKLGELLRRLTGNLALLSATPVHLRNSDLFHLLKLVDPDSFQHEWSFDVALEENSPLVELREQLLAPVPDATAIHEAIASVRESAPAQRSEALQFLLNQPTLGFESAGERLALAEQVDRANPITKVVTRTRKRDVHERRVLRAPIALSAGMTGVEAEFYQQVTTAVRRYCRRLDIGEGFLLTIPQRQMCSSMAAACRAWAGRSEGLDDEIDRIAWEAFGDDAVLGGGKRKRPDAKSLMHELSRIARDVGDFQALRRDDSKFAALLANVQEYWRTHGPAKVVLFAYFRGTLDYLAERFAEVGIDSVVLMGGMDKMAALARFKDPDGPRLLLASEVASEGIDLQFSSLLVNYDLPWNPMRIEQRIGRIDRIGQRAERIVIVNVMLRDTLDERVYVRLFERLRIFERALGSMEGILGEQIRTMGFDLLRHELTEEEEARVIEQTGLAAAKMQQIEEQLEQDAGRLVAHGDYLQYRIAAARDLNRFVTSEDLLAYVKDFVDSHCIGGQLVESGAGDPPLWELDLGAKARSSFAEFLERERLPSSRFAMAAAGRQPCTFENLLKRSRTQAEAVSQYHPLVGYIRNVLERDERFRHPVLAALTLDAGLAESQSAAGAYVFAVSRWVLTGERTVERLAFAVRKMRADDSLEPDAAERLITKAIMQGRNWLGVRNEVDGGSVSETFDCVIEDLDRRYTAHTEAAERENRDRIAFQLHQVERQAAREITRLQELIAKLRFERKTRTIPANEGRIARARQLFDERTERLRRRSAMTHESVLVCAGVLRV